MAISADAHTAYEPSFLQSNKADWRVLYRLPVQVHSGASQTLMGSVDPSILDVESVPVISRTLPVMIETPDQQNLSAVYELVGTPTVSPEQVTVIGPAPLVEQVSEVQTTVSLAETSDPWREGRPVRLLNEQGRELTGVNTQPNQVQVSVPIRRRLNVSQVSVRAVISGTPPAGYWLSSLSVNPASITLQGHPDQLTKIGGYVDTLPVDVSRAVGELSMEIPLDLPSEVQALDNEGNMIGAVTVVAQSAACIGGLVVIRPVELLRTAPGITITLNPSEVELLLSGPLSVLNEIEANRDLVQVLIDATDLGRNQSIDVIPTIVTPLRFKLNWSQPRYWL